MGDRELGQGLLDMRIKIGKYGKPLHCVMYAYSIPVGSKRTYTSILKEVLCKSKIERRIITNICKSNMSNISKFHEKKNEEKYTSMRQ
jgi:hypothetical protein